MPHSLSLVLPAYDEAASIERVVREADRALEALTPEAEILVVDDGSTDGTAEILARLAVEIARLSVIRHPANRGYGAALRSGYAAARGTWVAFMDGDGQFDSAEIARLWQARDGATIVTGYRIRRRDPAHRLLYARLYGWLVRWTLGVRVRDVNCGLKLYRRDFLRDLTLTSTGALINAEIYAHAGRRKSTVVEVGVTHLPCPAGRQTGGDPAVIVRMFRELLTLRKQLQDAPASGGPALAPASRATRQ